MQTCGQCGRMSLDYASFCTKCGSALGPDSARQTNAEEAGHIGYLLTQVVRWHADGWIASPLLRRILQTYEARREALLGPHDQADGVPAHLAPQAPEPSAPSPTQPPPMVPPPAEHPWEPQPIPQAVPRAVHVTRVQPEPPTPSTPWLAEFLAEHWLKLVAALAAALIFGGLRQLLALNWVGHWAVTLLPLVPGGLGGLFYYFGMREREGRSIGAFACTCVAIVLGAYTVFSANHLWLSGALGDRSCSLLAILCSCGLAGHTLALTRDTRYLHIVALGSVAAVIALMQVAAPSPLFAPHPAWAHGCALVALAGLFLGLSASSSPLPDDAPDTLRLWAHLSAACGVALGTMPSLLSGDPEAALATPLLAAGLMYAVTAEFYGSGGMARIGAACTAASVLVALRGAGPLEAYPVGLACAGLSAFWWLASLAPRRPDRSDVGDSYDLPFTVGVIAACCVLVLRIALTGSGAAMRADWVQGCLLAASCAALLAALAVRRALPAAMYGSAVALAFALGLATDRVLLLGHVLRAPSVPHDLIAFGALALLLGWCVAQSRRDDAPDWGLPWRRAAALTAWTGIVSGHFPEVALWSGLVPHVVLACLGAVLARQEARRGDARAWAAAAMLGLTLLPGDVAIGTHQWTWEPCFVARAVSLAAMAWVWLGLMRGIEFRAAGDPWRAPLEVGVVLSGVSALCGSVLWAHAPLVFGLTAACSGALALLPSASARKWPVGASYGAVVAGFCLAYLNSGDRAAPWAAAIALTGALVVASAARKEHARLPLWLSAACLPLLAMAGFDTADTHHVAAWLAAGDLAAAALAFGAVARWRSEQGFSYVAALAFPVGYVRAITLLFAVKPGWAALAVLPALAALEAAGRLLPPGDDADLFRAPFRATAVIGALVSLASGCSAAWMGQASLLGATLGLLAYAALLAIIAATDETPGEVLAALSAVVGAAGFGHAVFLDWATVPGQAMAWGAIAMALICGWAYLRVASASPAFGGLAAVSACAGWFAALHSLLHVPIDWWAAAMLPVSAGIWAAARWQAPRADAEPAAGSIRAGALGATLTVLLVSVVGGANGGPHWSMGAAVGLLVCGAACALAAVSETDASEGLAVLSAVVGAAGWCFAIGAPWGTRDGSIAAIVVAATAAVHAWVYLRMSRTTPGYAFLSSVACCGAWFALAAGVFRVRPEWWSVAAAPCLLALFLLLPGAKAPDDPRGAQRDAFRGGALCSGLALLTATVIRGTHQLSVWSLGVTIGLLVSWTLLALATAAEETPNDGLGALSVVVGLAGWGAAAIAPWASRSGEIAAAVAAASGLTCAWSYLRAARANSGYAYLATASACGGWFALIAAVCCWPVAWWPLAMLPCYAAIHALSESSAEIGGDDARQAMRDGVLALATLSATAALAYGALHPAVEALVVVTLCTYGLAMFAGAARGDRPVCTAIAGAVLTAAWAYAMALHPGITVPRWSCGMAAAGAVWLLVGRIAAPHMRSERHGLALDWLAGALTVGASLAGLATVQTPGEGIFTILTLAIGGAVWFGLYLFQQGEGFVHAGFASLFVAYGLMLYDQLRLSAAVIDFYLVPLGLYLIVLGHFAGSRRGDQSAAVLWWLGLLTTMTPTFVAFCDTRGTGSALFHAALLIVECLGSVAWGIANRIRAYAFCGAGFGFAFAAVMAGGRVADAGSAATALIAGVALLAFVYRVGTHQEETRLWIARVNEEWRRWR